jgi:hypothetical protein
MDDERDDAADPDDEVESPRFRIGFRLKSGHAVRV